MPASFGAIALPASIILLMLKQKGPADAFVKAGATTSETARRPSSLGIQSQYMIDSLTRSRILIAVGDGRYYVDLPLARRRSRRIIAVAVGLALVGAACVAWAFLGG